MHAHPPKETELLESLRHLIGASRPGTALPGQRDLCAQFGATTFRLHQSLRQLEREGLITVVPRKGIFVRKPEAVRQRFMQVIFLDNPRYIRIYEYGLTALVRAAAGQSMECHTTHIEATDRERLTQLLSRAADDGDCSGVVIAGYVSDETAAYLETVTQPMVLFGDVNSERMWPGLPIVCGDNFQGASLAAEHLISCSCDRLVLVNFTAEPDWTWVREARAGVMEAVERHADVDLLVPGHDAFGGARPDSALDTLSAWTDRNGKSRVGVLCRGAHMLQHTVPIRETLAARGVETITAVLEIAVTNDRIPGVRRVVCLMETLAQATMRRLGAIRRGADAPGRQRLPYVLMED